MARELLVHIGLPKTGSTALQTFLSRNHAGLLKHSIDYLQIGEFKEGEAGRIASGNGAYVARSLLPPGDAAYLAWEEARISVSLRTAILASPARTVLLSSELFALPKPEAWSNILKLCDECSLRLGIVAVVRNQSDWLSSAYLQDVKRRQLTREPVSYVRDLYRSTRFLKYNSYFLAMSELAAGRVKLVSFDKHAFNGTLMLEFLKTLGVEDDSIPIAQELINVSPNAEEIAFLRKCNYYKPSMNFSDILATSNPSAAGGPSSRWTVIDQALGREIQEFFQEENVALIKNYGLNGDFFSNPCPDFVDITEIEIGSEKMVSLFAQYLVSYDARLRSLSSQIDDLEKRIVSR